MYPSIGNKIIIFYENSGIHLIEDIISEKIINRITLKRFTNYDN